MMDSEHNEYIIQRQLTHRVAICKLILLALMWMQSDEDSQKELASEYLSPLKVENYTWLEDTYAERDIEHFRDFSNTVRMGIWGEILESKLQDLLAEFPTCLHDACLYALLGINMMLVDKELEGVHIHSQDKYFARTIAYDVLSLLGNTEMTKGKIYRYPMTVEEAKSVLPIHLAEELSEKLEQFVINSYEKDFKEKAPPLHEIKTDYLQTIYENFFLIPEGTFGYSNLYSYPHWYNDMNQEALFKLQEKYAPECAECAASPQTQGEERWGMTLVYLKSYFGASSYFASNQSDLVLSDSKLSKLESLDEDEDEDAIPPGYFRIKHYLDRYTDRTVVLSRLVHTLVYFLLMAENYQPSHIDKLMEIPAPLRAISSLQAALRIAVYRCSYYIAANNIPESEVGLNWLLNHAFPNLRGFYQAGRDGGLDVAIF